MSENGVRRSTEFKDTVLHIIAGVLLGFVINYFTLNDRLSRMENRLTTIESVVCTHQTCYRASN